MDELKKEYCQLKSELICPICLDVFKCDALQTECFHQFCKDCLENHVKISKNCPICRTQIRILGEYEPLLKKIERMEFIKKIIISDGVPCDFCNNNFENFESTTAEFKCVDCEKNFCQTCVDFHDQIESQHTVSDIYENTAFFSKTNCSHNSEKFCLSCDKYYCSVCDNSHLKHDIISKDEAEIVQQEKLENLRTVINNNYTCLQNSFYLVNEAEVEIENNFKQIEQEMTNYFNMMKEKALSKVKIQVENKLEVLKQQKKELDYALEAFETSVEFYQSVINNRILNYYYSDIKRRFITLSKEEVNFIPKITSIYEFYPEKEEFPDNIREISTEKKYLDRVSEKQSIEENFSIKILDNHKNITSISRNSNIFCVTENDNVVIYDNNFNYQFKNDYVFKNPCGAVMTADKKILVAEKTSPEIFIFNEDGTFFDKIRVTTKSKKYFISCIVVKETDGSIYISDRENSCIYIFSSTFVRIGAIINVKNCLKMTAVEEKLYIICDNGKNIKIFDDKSVLIKNNIFSQKITDIYFDTKLKKIYVTNQSKGIIYTYENNSIKIFFKNDMLIGSSNILVFNKKIITYKPKIESIVILYLD